MFFFFNYFFPSLFNFALFSLFLVPIWYSCTSVSLFRLLSTLTFCCFLIFLIRWDLRFLRYYHIFLLNGRFKVWWFVYFVIICVAGHCVEIFTKNSVIDFSYREATSTSSKLFLSQIPTTCSIKLKIWLVLYVRLKTIVIN